MKKLILTSTILGLLAKTSSIHASINIARKVEHMDVLGANCLI